MMVNTVYGGQGGCGWMAVYTVFLYQNPQTPNYADSLSVPVSLLAVGAANSSGSTGLDLFDMSVIIDA